MYASGAVNATVSWNDANDLCQLDGGTLAVVTSQDELQFIHHHISDALLYVYMPHSMRLRQVVRSIIFLNEPGINATATIFVFY